ncbi:MAG: UvrD-helicase domain-containing protein [Alistipes sp.]|nr:UvrD-helicase domain-containing protein [Candidatus Alistipes equi]
MSNTRAQILCASAGSGKTYQLAYKYVLDVIRNRTTEKGQEFFPNAYRTILAVTFTNKATEEMKSRIIEEIHLLATWQKSKYLEALKKDTGLSEKEIRARAKVIRTSILHDYSHFTVLTNDSFFQKILRAFIVELGMDMNYRVELHSADIVKRSADAILEKSDDKKLQQWIMDYASERVSNGEKWDIKSGILLLQEELFKEQTHDAITSIKNRDEFKKAVFTYIKKIEDDIEKFVEKAKNIVQQIRNEVVDKYLERYLFNHLEGLSNGKIKPTSNYVLNVVNNETWLKKEAEKKHISISQDLCNDIKNLIKKLEYDIIPGQTNIKILKQSFRSFILLKDLYDCAKKVSSEDNALILSETKHTIARLINDMDAPFIYEKVGCRFERIMIDEFQDTSLKEWKNFLPLILNAVSNAIDSVILIVGDIKQSIYRWRGGDWSILAKIAPQDIEKAAEIDRMSLSKNYRSKEAIVKFNRNFFNQASKEDNENLNSWLDQTTEAFRKEHFDALKNAYADIDKTEIGKEDAKGGYVRVAVYKEQPEINPRIKALLDIGYRPCDITILTRTKTEAQQVAKMLLELRKEADSKYHVGIMTQEALLLESSPMIKFLTAVLRLAIKREDPISRGIFFRHAHNMDFISELTEEENNFLNSICSLSIIEAVQEIMSKYRDILITETAYTLSFNEQVIHYGEMYSADIASFLEWWDKHCHDLTVTIAKDARSIEIMTIHKSKGLENKVIIIPFCNWKMDVEPYSPSKKNMIWTEANDGPLKNLGLYPVRAAKEVVHSAFSNGYIHEMIYSHIDAINLLYVAFTRAKEHLYVYSPKANYEQYKTKKSLDTVDTLLYRCIELTDTETEEDSCVALYESGKFEHYKNDETDTNIYRYKDYTASKMETKLSLRTERYYDEESGTISNRQIGILLHEAFQHSKNISQIKEKINELEKNGLLSKLLSDKILSNVRELISKEPVRSWFSENWDKILNEKSILIPNEKDCRPDRVLIKADQAVIIDYKFGNKNNYYNSKLKKYAKELRSMGYTSVKAYLWYVVLNEIEEVL